MPKHFKLLSFDLDNALYDNQPVLENAERLSATYLQQQFLAQKKVFDIENFNQLKQKLLQSGDPAYENLSYFRLLALKNFCNPLTHATAIAEKAFNLFIQARSQVIVPDAIEQMLQTLSTNYTLVSVSNGNCDINQSTIGCYFSKNYSPIDGYRAKPNPQMLLQVIRDFNLAPEQILHIGDSISKDAAAAEKAGVSFFHFAPFEKADKHQYYCQNLQQYLVSK